jgi:hypothetical protein
MGRMLASVQRCIGIHPIQGADKIEVAQVLGWECVVKKGTFKVGDLGVYFEIDSILPPITPFEFMRERKFRVKTVKLRGQVSQGLFMSFDDLGIKKCAEGYDLTYALGVEKWEPEEKESTPPPKKGLWWKLVYTLPFLKMFRKKVGTGTAFPTHLVPKTDEPRLQTFGEGFLDTYKDLMISITQKMDGSSCTFILNKGKFSVASRNVWFLERKDNDFWRVAEQTNLIPAMKNFFKGSDVCIQGEVCGPGIQGNKYGFKELHFFLFGAYDSKDREYVTPAVLKYIHQQLLSNGATIDIVDELMNVTSFSDEIIKYQCIRDIGLTVDDWVKFATTKSTYNPKSYNEGIVVRSIDNMPYGIKGMTGKRFSFKIISPEFLLQYGL